MTLSVMTLMRISLVLFLTLGLWSESSASCGKNGNKPCSEKVSDKFAMKKLKRPDQDPIYTFILVQHGMVVPDSNPFPNDNQYDPKWTKGQVTERGKQLMQVVGSSLKHRYRKILDGTGRKNIRLSAMDKPYAQEMLQYVAKGLFSRTQHKSDIESMSYSQEFDKTQKLLENGFCRWMNVLLKDLDTEPIKTCSKDLYKTLRKAIQKPDQPLKKGDEWYIDSPQKTCNLRKMVLFRLYQGIEEPDWSKTEEAQQCPANYYLSVFTYHNDMRTLLIGEMLYYMKYKKSSHQKFHLHVTDDITVVALNSSIPYGIGEMIWPTYGSTLIIDFFDDGNVEVSTYKPVVKSYHSNYKGGTSAFFEHFMSLGQLTEGVEWYKICYYEDSTSKPESSVVQQYYRRSGRPPAPRQ